MASAQMLDTGQELSPSPYKPEFDVGLMRANLHHEARGSPSSKHHLPRQLMCKAANHQRALIRNLEHIYDRKKLLRESHLRKLWIHHPCACVAQACVPLL